MNKDNTKLVLHLDNRVFCKLCKHYEDNFDYDECWAEGNLIYKPDYYSNWKHSIRSPRKINKFNDCRWYEKSI